MRLEPHHDGSELYVEPPDEAGGDAIVRMRVPHGAPEPIALRYVRDGEPRVARPVLDEESDRETWWRASFAAWNPVTRYRWLLADDTWLNGAGIVDHEVPDADDFVLAPAADGPGWHLRSVVYEIFPDRFAPNGRVPDPPGWAVPRAWDELPTGRGRDTPLEWFGGALGGIEAQLEHVERLGASVLYLTPIFPAGSTHRYDAATFARVDPLLGGDEALASLVAAAHARGMRVVGDLTLNHTGSGHEWFAAARAGAEAPERGFYLFDDSGGYESWLGVRTLPKLDHRSPELGRRLADVAARWLREPFDLDGWRIDVANMTGRYRDVDATAAVAERVRRAVSAAKPDALLIAEHGHDFRPDLDGAGWQAAMNYAGFLRPVWWWLRSDEFVEHPFLELPAPRYDGAQAVATMRAFRAGVPWQATLHSWALLDSHDTARFRTVAGSRERHVVGIGLQMTTPGVPMVFAGDELGLEGSWGEDARRTMPWARPETWDTALLGAYRSLIALRRSSDALARGGIRYVHVAPDAIAYLRETRAERLLCLASRAPHAPLDVPAGAEPLYGGDGVGEGPAFHVWRLP